MNKTQKNKRDEVLSDNPERILVKHVRGRRGARVGVLAGVKHPKEDFFRIGWSKCNPKADQFDPKVGLEIAVGRAFKSDSTLEDIEYCKGGPFFLTTDDSFRNGLVAAGLPPSMNKDTFMFVDRCIAYFKRSERSERSGHSERDSAGSLNV